MRRFKKGDWGWIKEINEKRGYILVEFSEGNQWKCPNKWRLRQLFRQPRVLRPGDVFEYDLTRPVIVGGKEGQVERKYFYRYQVLKRLREDNYECKLLHYHYTDSNNPKREMTGDGSIGIKRGFTLEIPESNNDGGRGWDNYGRNRAPSRLERNDDPAGPEFFFRIETAANIKDIIRRQKAGFPGYE